MKLAVFIPLMIVLLMVLMVLGGLLIIWKPILEAMPPKQTAFNWAIQGQDGAIQGCPGQYATWAEIDTNRYLIGCWGKK